MDFKLDLNFKKKFIVTYSLGFSFCFLLFIGLLAKGHWSLNDYRSVLPKVKTNKKTLRSIGALSAIKVCDLMKKA